MIDTVVPAGQRQSGAGNLNAGVKLGATLLLTCALVVVKDWVSTGSILLLEMLLLALWGINPVRLLGRFWPVLFATVFSGWSVSLLADKTGSTVIELGLIWVTTDSLLTGAALMLRGLAMVLPGLLLISTTDPVDIADSLAQTVRLPARFVLGALAAFRLVDLMLDEWKTLGQARRARGVGSRSNLFGRVHTLGGQVFALLVQAIRRGSRLAITMEARGFGAVKQRTWARRPTYSPADLRFVLGVLAVILAGYFIAHWAGSLTFIWQ